MNPGYYIYYRVAPGREDEARRLVTALQEEVYRDTRIRGTLLARRDDALTWMEIYEDVADEAALERSLAVAAVRCGFDRVLAAGSRRVTEVFAPF